MPNPANPAAPPSARQLRRYRLAALALFGLNGWLYASWAARVPDIQIAYGIDDAAVGLVLITASLGAFLSMPFAAYLSERLGGRRLASLSALLYVAAVPLIPRLPAAAALYGLYFFIGVGFGLLDVAMNAQAVEVEKRLGRPIVSSFHAVFSAAMIGGALGSSAAIYLGLGTGGHLLAASALALALLAFAYPRMIPDELADEDLRAAAGAAPGAAAEPPPAFRLPVPATYLLGAVGFCSMMSEASIADWTAKFMREVAGATDFVAPFSLAAFSVTMTGGRVFGDGLRARLGDARLLRYGALVAFGGMALTIGVATPASTIAGAALVGTGLSVAVPIVFSLSGGIPGLSASAALAMVTTISYVGLFLGPAIIGFLADRFGLRVGYLWILGALGVLVALVWRVRPAGPAGVTAGAAAGAESTGPTPPASARGAGAP